ncbi:MAG: sodium:proton antiporter [Planctomycetota bacterium]
MGASLLLAAGGHALPPYPSVAPFILILLGIAILPLVAHHWWESNRNRAIFVTIIAAPFAIWWWSNYGVGALLHGWEEYLSFIALVGSLYVVAGGIFLRGSLKASPGANTMLMAIGAVLANLLGTTGASMVLIRPFLRANAHRPVFARVLGVVFFIFTVSNVGGCLTPLGDPPLFLGFLRGVDFFWTLGLAKEWAFALALILALYYVWDRLLQSKEEAAPVVAPEDGKLGLEGRRNLPLLLCIMGAVICKGQFGWPFGPQEAIMALVAVVSMVVTRKDTRKKNHFSFGPILEVAILFAGIFTVMVAPLAILEVKGGDLGLEKAWQYFWVTGGLSSFLDNAPTYVVFGQTAATYAGADSIGELMTKGPMLLVGISLGAVFMGAMTYIGNAPNFMVKAIAEENEIKMPSFFGYMKYSVAILIPIYLIVTLVFL